MDYTADSAAMIAEFANATVAVRLEGVDLATFRAIYDETPDEISPYEAEATGFKPRILVESSAMATITAACVLHITRDIDAAQLAYKYNGRPRPDGAGMTVIHLGKAVSSGKTLDVDFALDQSGLD